MTIITSFRRTPRWLILCEVILLLVVLTYWLLNTLASGPLRSLEGNAKAPISELAFAPDGQMIVGTDGESLFLWPVSGGAARQINGVYASDPGVAFSPDGQIIAAISYNQVQTFRASDGTLLVTLEKRSGALMSVAFSPDGASIAAGAATGVIYLWNTTDGKLIQTLKGPKLFDRNAHWIAAIAFSPDGQTIVGAVEETNTVCIWRVSDGTIRRTMSDAFQVPYGRVGLAYSLDGKFIAVGTYEGHISIWPGGVEKPSDKTAEVPLRYLEGHEAAVISLAFSPDSRLVAAGSVDRTVSVWDIRSGASLRRWQPNLLLSPGNAVNAVAFSPDGKLLSTANDLSVRLWEVPH